MEKSCEHHLNHMIKLNISNNGTNWKSVPLDMIYGKGHNITYVVFLPNVFNVLNNEKKINSTLRDILKNNWPVLFKNVTCSQCRQHGLDDPVCSMVRQKHQRHKKQTKVEELFWLMETKETWQVHGMHVPSNYKCYYWNKWRHLNITAY